MPPPLKPSTNNYARQVGLWIKRLNPIAFPTDEEVRNREVSTAALVKLYRNNSHRFLCALLLMVVLFYVQGIVSRSIMTPATPSGIVSLELAWNSSTAGDILKLWNDANHIQIQDAIHGVWIDFLCIFAYVWVLIFACKWVAQNLRLNDRLPQIQGFGKVGGLLVWLAVIAGVSDAIENIGLLLMLKFHFLLLAPVTSAFTVIKFALIGLAVMYILMGLPMTQDAALFFKAFKLVGFNLIVASVASSLVLFLPQGQELLQVLGEDLHQPVDQHQPSGWPWFRLVLFFVLAIYLAWVSYDWAMFLYVKHKEKSETEQSLEPGNSEWPFHFLIRLCGIVPLALLGFALIKAVIPVQIEARSSESLSTMGYSPEVNTALIAMSVAMVVIVALSILFVDNAKERTRVARGNHRGRIGWIGISLLFGSLMFLVTALPSTILWPGRFGACSVILAGFSFFIPIGSALVWINLRRRVNVLVLLLSLAAVWALLDIGDNHEVRRIPSHALPAVYANREGASQNIHKEMIVADITTLPKSTPDVHVLDMNAAFTAWLAARSDLKTFGSKPYPVFFISAEGGGIRAAYQTAALLAKLQEKYPRFAQHTFMISGVSGGSLGAAVFASLAQYHAANQPDDQIPTYPWTNSVDKILEHDLLSAPLASTLSADLAQRFLPFGFPDRAQALELALEKAWEDGTAPSVYPKQSMSQNRVNLNDEQAAMRSSLYRLNDDFIQGAHPALFFNTTCVETGSRMVVSNLWPRSYEKPLSDLQVSVDNDGAVDLLPGVNGLQCLAGIAPDTNVRLSTAAVMSARFPGISSAGMLKQRRVVSYQVHGNTVFAAFNDERRYVDGGYFENSGISTLNDVLIGLGAYVKNDPKQKRREWFPVIISIGFQDGSTIVPAAADALSPNIQISAPFDELSPLFTYVNLSGAHGQLALDRIPSYLAQIKEVRDAKSCWLPFRFRTVDAPLPLGWLLSERARRSLKGQTNTGPNMDSFQSIGALLAK